MRIEHRSPAKADPTPVIALHCSGAGAGQWRQLREVLGPAYQVIDDDRAAFLSFRAVAAAAAPLPQIRNTPPVDAAKGDL